MFVTPTDHILFVPFRSLGGADTNSSEMAWWMLAMLAYPETQARAHAELDAVVGRARLPTFADYPHLPYIRAMVKEVLRWRPVGPMGMTHRSTEDDWYEGMFIPKGTTCITNLWHMNRDPEIFGENAEHFDPGRYLDASGALAHGISNIKEQGHFSYGFGRRVCVGRHMANNSLFINIAVLLWAAKFERKKDATGRLLPLDLDGWVDVGLAVLADFIVYRYVDDANVGILTDVQSPSNLRSLRASRRQLQCFHRNVSCGGFEQEVYRGWIHR
jgi:cytochrome P450